MDTHHIPADWLDAPGRWAFLDPPGRRIADLVNGLPLGRAREALHGEWLGHPLHPAIAQFPLGCWLAAGLLDATRADDRAARRLTAAGLVALPPVLLAGWVDWSKLTPVERRTGLTHAATAVTAAALQAASLRARCHGHHVRGRMLGLTACGVVTLAAALGGHLAYRQATAAERRPATLDTVEDHPAGDPDRPDR
ncbi:DUF2231 domain-containing protein [Streptomyces sp. TLI_171]|uniref:DUF2231 domain-containing protein n=1 Tax=Streptomyces sp. TLI_171 TaxID=1938859 RepID=UPI000C19EA9D|nr:DUF2231 domain-containing protein [Streptomyces sp. TLI_171]RKE17469.1 hypothetical protein BX266_0727 [Streptomyces sp. TLI_171]